MRKQDQNNIFRHKKKIPKFSKTPSPVNLKEHSKLASKSSINDKHLNILNLQTYSVNEDSSLNEKYKIKSKEYKIKLQQTQDQLYSRNNKIAQLNNQILYLQSQLIKQKQEISEYQNKINEIQLQQPSLIIIEDSSNEKGVKEIMAVLFNLLSQMNSLVNKQKDSEYQQEYSKLAKEMHESLIQVQQLFYKKSQESKQSFTKNEKEINEAKLQLRNLQVINEELAQKIDHSQYQQDLTTSQYKESLLQMKDRVQNMRTKILQLELKNQQEIEVLQKQLQQIKLEKQEQNDNVQKLKQSLSNKQIENKQLKEQMKLLQIKNEEFIKQIQKVNSLKQISNLQLRSLDLYNSTEVDLKGEISQLDDDIQKLQLHLQQALKDQSHIVENQQPNAFIQMFDNISDFYNYQLVIISLYLYSDRKKPNKNDINFSNLSLKIMIYRQLFEQLVARILQIINHFLFVYKT